MIGCLASRWLLMPCIVLSACGGSGSDSSSTLGNSHSGGRGGSSGGSDSFSSSGFGNGSGSDASTSSASGSGSSSGSSSSASGGSSSGNSAGGSGSSSVGGDGGSGEGGDDSGGVAGGGCSPAYVRGPDPTSDSASKTGPYQTLSYAADGSVRMTMKYDVTSAHIYYPTGATPPFTALSVVPGFVSAESSIANWGPFLASWGIVVMTIGTSNPMTGASDTSVLPPVRADALIDALETIKGENTRSGSPLAGKLDLSRLAVSGWSMGGGGTLIDANTHPELKATMAMCAWNPSGTYPMDTVPTLMFGGTADGLAGPPMPENQYMSIPSATPKLLYVINGGSHFVANDPAGQSGNIGRFGLSWMKVFLECDLRFKQFLTIKPSDASEFNTTVM